MSSTCRLPKGGFQLNYLETLIATETCKRQLKEDQNIKNTKNKYKTVCQTKTRQGALVFFLLWQTLVFFVLKSGSDGKLRACPSRSKKMWADTILNLRVKTKFSLYLSLSQNKTKFSEPCRLLFVVTFCILGRETLTSIWCSFYPAACLDHFYFSLTV